MTQSSASAARVLYLSPVPNFKGGAERSLMHLLQNPGIEPWVAAPAPGPVLEAACQRGLPTYALDTGSIDQVKRPFRFRDGVLALKDLVHASRTLAAYCRAHKIAVVHSNGLKAHIINGIARRCFDGAPAVLHLRDIALTRSEHIVWEIMRRLADHLILVSRPCWPGASLPSNASVIHNGVDLDSDPGAPKSFSGDTLTFAVVGRLHPEKGQHLALDWLAAMHAAGIPARLSIRGEFTTDAPEYEAELQQKMTELGLQQAVEFTGFISDPEAVYADVDVVLVPSIVPDPLPRAVMEGMDRYIPVIAYPSGGIPEMIDDGVTGYLTTTPNGCVEAVQALRREPEQMVKMLRAAREKLVREFSSESLYHGVNEVYARLTAPATGTQTQKKEPAGSSF